MSEIGKVEAAATRGTIPSGRFALGYSVEGNGTPALVVGSAVYYPRTFSDRLRQSLKLHFVDHRGFARVAGALAPEDYTLDVVLDDIDRARRHFGLDRIVIVGHSGHGFMALEYAKKYPQHVSHVVLIGMGPSHGEAHHAAGERNWQEAVCPERKAKLERDLQSLPAEIAAAPEKRFVTFCIRLGARSWYDHDFDATPLWEGVHVNMPVFDHLWGEAFRDLDIAKGLERFDKPVFLALGRFDYLVAPASTWEPYRQHFRDLTVRVFDRSSHTPQLEERDLFDAELLGWLSQRAR